MIDFRNTQATPTKKSFDLLFQKKQMTKYPVSESTIVRFVKDLSTLINAAVPLVKSLEVLSKQQKDEKFALIIKTLADSVYSGMPFSISLLRFSKVFDTFFISMVKAGESSCNLGEILVRIAKHKEKELKLRKKIRSIMIYPVIVMSIATLIVSLLFLFIIPKFESVFSTTLGEAAIPLATRMIIAVSHGFQEISLFLLVVMVGLFLTIKLIKKGIKDKLILKVPIVGNVVRDVNVALFSRILGTLLTNGVPLIQALKISENIATNDAVSKSLKNARKKIENGEALSQALENEKQVPELMRSLIHVGEETGTLSNMLLEVSNKLEDDLELTLESLTSVLEPLMTLLLAVIIGSIVIALFLPIVNVMNNIVTF